MPHSEKSNDSSDADSVHSLPIDDLNMPISYADIAKNSEKLKEKKSSPEKVVAKEKSPIMKADQEPKVQQNPKKSPNLEKNAVTEKSSTPYPTPILPKTPPDVNNIKNFPSISADISKNTLVISPINKHTDLQNLPIKNNTEIKSNHQELSNEVQHVSKFTATTPSVDVVIFTKKPSSSSSSSEASHPPHIPKIVPEMTSTKNLPPDVHNIRNFPAMPIVNKNVVTEKVSNNSKNNSLTVNSKIRNISPGNNNNNNNNSSKSAKSGHINNNNSLKSSGRNASNVVNNDIQNDLTVSIYFYKYIFITFCINSMH